MVPMCSRYFCALCKHTCTHTVHTPTNNPLDLGRSGARPCLCDGGLNGFLWLMYSIKSSISGLSCMVGFRWSFFRIWQRKKKIKDSQRNSWEINITNNISYASQTNFWISLIDMIFGADHHSDIKLLLMSIIVLISNY